MRINFWHISSFVISLFVIIPILTVFSSFFDNTSNYYQVLKDTFLLEYIFNSLILLVSVLILTFIIGTGSAYLVSFFNFPFSNFFKWALILSFAVPPYIYAYSLTAFFENYGTGYTILKNLFGEGNYNPWIAFDDLAFANQLSFFLLLFIFALFILENLSRKNAKYHFNTKAGFKQKQKIQLSGKKAFLAFSFCFLVFFLSFLFPLSQMMYWTIKFPENLFDLKILDLLMNTLYLVILSSLLLIIFGLLFVGILVSLEIIRELPITLILRPFNFETFATTAYISASEDLLEAAAVPSLFLILIATFFIIVTSKYILRDNND